MRSWRTALLGASNNARAHMSDSSRCPFFGNYVNVSMCPDGAVNMRFVPFRAVQYRIAGCYDLLLADCAIMMLVNVACHVYI